MSLLFLDMFGIGIGLRYMNKHEYQTCFGVGVTIIIGCILAIQIFLIGQEVIFKTNPEVVYAERFVASPARFNITRKTLNFAFGAQFPGNFSQFIDETIYTVDANQVTMEKKYNQSSGEYYQEWKTLPIGIHPCTSNDFEIQDSIDYFNKLAGVSNMYCLDYDSQNLFIEGNFDQDQFGIIQINFKMCQGKPYCRNTDEIQQALTNSYIALYTNDLIVNPKNINPFSIISRDMYWSTNPIYPKDTSLYFRNIYFETDNGLIFQDIEVQKQTQLSYTYEQVIFGETDYFFSMTLRFEKAKESIYHRKYKKLESILAEIGGIAKALAMIGFIICVPINQLKLYNKLSNSVFKYSKNTHQKHEENQSPNQKLDGQTIIQIMQAKNEQNNKYKLVDLKNQSVDQIQTQKQLDDLNQTLNNQTLTNIPQSIGQICKNQILSQNNIKGLQTETKVRSEVLFKPINQSNIKSNVISGRQFKVEPLDITHLQHKKNQFQDVSEFNLVKISKQANKANQNNQKRLQNEKELQIIKDQCSLKDTEIHKIDDEFKELFTLDNPQSQNDEKLQLKWSDYLRYYLWPFGSFAKKKKQIDYSVEKIYQHLDIIYIVKKLLEFEKVKQVLLNDDQRKLIQFFPKPLIDVEDISQEKEQEKKIRQSQKQLQKLKQKKQKINLLNDLQIDEKQRAQEAVQSLQNIIKQQYLSEVDKKIIEMLDDSIFQNICGNYEWFKQQQNPQEMKLIKQIDQDNTQTLSNQNINKLDSNDSQVQKIQNEQKDFQSYLSKSQDTSFDKQMPSEGRKSQEFTSLPQIKMQVMNKGFLILYSQLIIMSLLFLDMFGIGIGLRYINKNQYQTCFGVGVTIIIGCILAVQIFLIGQEVIFKTNPEVIYAERFVASPARFNITRKTLNLAFGAQFPGNFSQFIDESIYTVNANQINMQKKYNQSSGEYYQEWNTLPIGIHPCTSNDFEEQDSIDYFNKLVGVQNMYCLDYESQNLFIEGNFDQDQFGYIQIKFKICQGKPYCKNTDEIQKALINSYIALYTNDVIVNPKNVNPFSIISRDMYWSTNPIYPKDTSLYYRNIYFETDNGLIFQDIEVQKQTQLSYTYEQVIFGETDYFFSMILRFEKAKESIYHRQYKKIQSILAEIGGIAKALAMIGFIICVPINQLKLYNKLSNSVFKYSNNTHQKHEENQFPNQKVDGQTIIQIMQAKNEQSYKYKLADLKNQSIDQIQTQKQIEDLNQTLNNQTLTNIPQSIGQICKNQILSQKNIKGLQTETKVRSEIHFKPINQQNIKSNIISGRQFKVEPLDNSHLQHNKSQFQDVSDFNLFKISKQTNKVNLNLTQNNQKRFQNEKDLQISKDQFSLKNIETHKIDEEFKELFTLDNSQKQNDEKLQLKWSDYIRYYLWPFGSFAKKKKQIDYSVEKIYQHLDIIYIVKKLLEFEKVKQILLNDDQRKLIQFFPKPLIDVEEIKQEKMQEKKIRQSQKLKQKKQKVNLLNDLQIDEDQRAQEALQSLQNIIKQQYLSEVDKKIIEMLDDSIFQNICGNQEWFKQQQNTQEMKLIKQIDQDNTQTLSNQNINKLDSNDSQVQKIQNEQKDFQSYLSKSLDTSFDKQMPSEGRKSQEFTSLPQIKIESNYQKYQLKAAAGRRMINIFSKLDFYGVGLSLRYNEDQYFQTKFGGVITLIVAFLIGVQFIFSIKEVIDKKNPEVIQSEQYNPNPERFDMKYDTFNFCIGVQHSGNYSHYIDESVYEVIAKQQIMQRVFNNSTQLYEQKYIFIDIPMKPCTHSSFGIEETQDYFQKLPGVNRMYCLDNAQQDLFIQGNYDQNESGIVTITFQKCSNKAYCRQEDEIDKILTHSFVAFYSTDVIIDSKQYDAFQTIGRDLFWNISPTVAKDAYIFYRNIYIQNNEGFFFSEVNQQSTTTFSYQQEQIIFDESSYFFTLQLRNEKQKQTLIQRNYKKIDRLLAEIGGIAKALVMVGWVICIPLNRLMLNEKLMNDLFNFQQKRDLKLKKKKQQKTQDQNSDSKKQMQYLYNDAKIKIDKDNNAQDCNNKIQNLQKQINQDAFHSNNSNQKDSAPPNCKTLSNQQENQQVQTKKVKILNNQLSLGAQNDPDNLNDQQDEVNIQLSWYQYIRYYLWPWGGFKKLKKSIEKTVSQVHHHLDIIQLVRFQLEFEKIKQLLFDEDQIKLLQFLPKPIINLDENKDNNIDPKYSSAVSLENNSIYYKKQQSEQQIKNEVEKALNNIATPKYNRKYNFDRKSRIFKKIETSYYIDESCGDDVNSENITVQPCINTIYQSFPQKSHPSQQQLKESSLDKNELQNFSNISNIYKENPKQCQLNKIQQTNKSSSELSISLQLDNSPSSCLKQVNLDGQVNKLPQFKKLYFSSQDIIFKKNPEVIQSEQYQPNPEQFDMKKDTYNFSIGVQYPKNCSHFIDESIYEVFAQQITMSKVKSNITGQFEQVWNYQEIPMKPCKKENFQLNSTSQYFNNLPNIDQMYCLADENQDVFIQGNFDQDTYALIRIEFRPCVGKSYCRKYDEIIKILTSSYVAMYMSDVIVNPGDLNPFQHVGKDIFWNNSPRVSRDIDIYFRNIVMQSDEGALFTDIGTLKSTQYSYFQESIIFEEQNYFFSVQLRFEKQKQTNYVRKYKKIDRLLAEIGGIAKALIMIGFFFIHPINQILLKQNIINDLFIFQKCSEKNEQNETKLGKLIQCNSKVKIQKSKKEDNNLKGQQNLKKQPLKFFKNSSQLNPQKSPLTINISVNQDQKQSSQQISPQRIIDLNQFQINQDASNKNKNATGLNKIINHNNTNTQYEQNQFQKFQLTWSQYIKYYLYPWGEIQRVKQFVEQTTKIFYQHLDLGEIIKKQIEFEKIKQILLDSDQVKILEYLPKPTLDMSQLLNQKSINLSIIQKSIIQQSPILLNQQEQIQEQQKIEDVKVAVTHLKKKLEINQIDKKLLKIIENNGFCHLNNHEGLNETGVNNKQTNFQSKYSEQNQLDALLENTIPSPCLENLDEDKFKQLIYNSKNKIQFNTNGKVNQKYLADKSTELQKRIIDDPNQLHAFLSSSSCVLGIANPEISEDGQINSFPQTNSYISSNKYIKN
ncbi:transmembrane protein, putative (macronuclear) [Tetrahymena thermophila SB210]|uniref:Transmembrane protein, putative n=1 Tax=Tetrahymena thermophila (strain SB210) TaxID=312017 RepID=W7X7Z6_TETTS|nr:transmembrane protein, putative [Tetrahymena thermophila SB210]EWS72548.1 transmembrane protein, putative [Tetrahymena thermophila SB210]|eukprot:XP_012654928.1 transmembrane protein, putative [Tetrahymena thermophila SB210]